MNEKEQAIKHCAYFFEVLVKQFIELEKHIHKQCRFLSLFRKINFVDITNKFIILKEKAIEIKHSLSTIENKKDDEELYSFICILEECVIIYIDMIETQIKINTGLSLKANGETYNWNDYRESLKYFDTIRDKLELKLKQLQVNYAQLINSK